MDNDEFYCARGEAENRKIGAAIVRNTRRVRLLLASNHPLPHLYRHVAQALAP